MAPGSGQDVLSRPAPRPSAMGRPLPTLLATRPCIFLRLMSWPNGRSPLGRCPFPQEQATQNRKPGRSRLLPCHPLLCHVNNLGVPVSRLSQEVVRQVG